MSNTTDTTFTPPSLADDLRDWARIGRNIAIRLNARGDVESMMHADEMVGAAKIAAERAIQIESQGETR